MFTITDCTKYEFYTCYKINYKDITYTCNYNGGVAKLEGKRLSERLRCELSDVLEEYFLNSIGKTN